MTAAGPGGKVIGIDARLYAGDYTGIGTYTRALIDRLAALDHRNRYLLFTDRRMESPAANFEVARIPVRQRVIWTHLCLPLDPRAWKLDLYHAVANHELPILLPGIFVLTVHDLIPLLYPETVPRRHRFLFGTFIRPAVRRAAAIITDCRLVKQSLVERFGLDPARIHPIPLACDPVFATPVPPEEVERVRRTYRLGERCLLYVGALEPRKNIPSLIDAFTRVAARPEFGEWRLALAGGGGWGRREVTRRAAAAGLAERIILPGFIAPRDLPALYRAADLFVYPSLYEGFGLPVLEAMAAGVPVLVSAPTALQEVAGPAGATFRLDDPGDLERQLTRLMGDAPLRASLAAAGLERAASFSWERCARETLAVYESVLGDGPD